MPLRPRHIVRLARLLAAGLMLLPASLAQADEVTVFAAASLKTALDAIAPAFGAQTGHDVTLSLAGSSVLARQIALGAPADVFISANAGWMDQLESEGLIAPRSRADIVGNRLVLVAHGSDAAPLELADLPARLGNGHLAMALVAAVPAGIYGKAALTHLDLWQQLEPRIAQADNVRAALALVALGEAPFGIVYATDAMAEPRVVVVATFPADSHPPITYPAAAIAGRDSPAALAFLAFLQGPSARATFKAQGFSLPGEARP